MKFYYLSQSLACPVASENGIGVANVPHYRVREKRLEITAARGKIGSGDLCKEREIAFLFEWEKHPLTKAF